MVDMMEGIITPVTSEEMSQVPVFLTEWESSLLQANINTTRVNSSPNANVVADTRGGECRSPRPLSICRKLTSLTKLITHPIIIQKLVEFQVLSLGKRL